MIDVYELTGNSLCVTEIRSAGGCARCVCVFFFLLLLLWFQDSGVNALHRGSMDLNDWALCSWFRVFVHWSESPPPFLWSHSLEDTTRYVLFMFSTCRKKTHEFSIVRFKMSFIYVISICAVYVYVFVFFKYINTVFRVQLGFGWCQRFWWINFKIKETVGMSKNSIVFDTWGIVWMQGLIYGCDLWLNWPWWPQVKMLTNHVDSSVTKMLRSYLLALRLTMNQWMNESETYCQCKIEGLRQTRNI